MKLFRRIFPMVCVAAAICDAGETVLVEQKFENEEGLNHWHTSQKPIFKDPKYQFSIQEEDGVKFLHTSNPLHLGTLLQPAVKVDDSVLRLEVVVEMRNAKGANPLSFSVSDEPHYFENPFRKGARDSGFYIQGYQYGNQYNFLKWRKNGEEIFCRPSVEPLNFLPPAMEHRWVTWKLVYNHAEKQLEFWRGDEPNPFLVQHGVDLSGITLKRLFLKCGSSDYRSAKAILVTK